MVVGDNGIIAKAQTAKTRTNESQAAEENSLKDLEKQIDAYTSQKTGVDNIRMIPYKILGYK